MPALTGMFCDTSAEDAPLFNFPASLGLYPLAASLFKEFNNHKLKTVTVIDPDPLIMTKWRKLLSRKNVKDAQWAYFADFAEFVNSKQ